MGKESRWALKVDEPSSNPCSSIPINGEVLKKEMFHVTQQADDLGEKQDRKKQTTQ